MYFRASTDRTERHFKNKYANLMNLDEICIAYYYDVKEIFSRRPR